MNTSSTPTTINRRGRNGENGTAANDAGRKPLNENATADSSATDSSAVGVATLPISQALDSETANEELWQEDVSEAITAGERQLGSKPNYVVMFWIGMLHIGAVIAPFYFSWQAVVVALFLYWLTGSIGVCLGYHRLLTHTAFQTYQPVRWFVALIGGLSGEGSAVDWVANHRKHHAHSDHDGDPHSPRDGAWWAHIFWLGWAIHGKEREAHVKRWAPDLVKDTGMRWLDLLFLPIHIGSGLALYGTYMAISMLLWGLFARIILVMHATWLVNSASHIWGYRNYETTDDSRNNWWVAILTFGEGWHNNHHAYPRMAKQGHRWWELDPTFAVIRIMQLCGLAWNVVDYRSKSKKKLG
jgi:fatty-acid desaturase